MDNFKISYLSLVLFEKGNEEMSGLKIMPLGLLFLICHWLIK